MYVAISGEIQKSYKANWTVTFLDFFCCPVAQIFRQNFSHVAPLWEHLNDLQVRASSWEDKGLSLFS